MANVMIFDLFATITGRHHRCSDPSMMSDDVLNANQWWRPVDAQFEPNRNLGEAVATIPPQYCVINMPEYNEMFG